MTTTMTMTTCEEKILALLERLVEAQEKAAGASWGRYPKLMGSRRNGQPIPSAR